MSIKDQENWYLHEKQRKEKPSVFLGFIFIFGLIIGLAKLFIYLSK